MHETEIKRAEQEKDKMTEWHRLFGLVLIDYFMGSPYAVELEKDLSLKRQFVDVIIIEHATGEPLAEVPDGLENLGQHNVLSYKSFQEPFSAWACDELLGHYVNYRKQVSPSMDNLLPVSAFRLYGVSTRYPQKLAKSTTLHTVKAGVYDLDWGSQRIRLIVTNQVAEIERNAIWQLFSANPDHVKYGAAHYQWHSNELSTILYELYQRYRLEGIAMPYTANDFYREFTRSHLDWLSVQERLNGVSLEERIKDFSPEDVLDTLLSGDMLARVSPEKWEQFVQQLRHQDQQK